MGKFIMRPVATGIKFDLLAGNGEVIATSEVYKTAAACRKGIQSTAKNAPNAALEDLCADGEVVSNPKFQIFEDKAGQFRFRLRSRNGAVIATSEGYATKEACQKGIESVRTNAVDAQIEEI